jgi:hypothetical protein
MIVIAILAVLMGSIINLGLVVTMSIVFWIGLLGEVSVFTIYLWLSPRRPTQLPKATRQERGPVPVRSGEAEKV